MSDMIKEKDRIGKYLIPHLQDYIFDELSDAYLEKAGVKDILGGVPVPVNRNELQGGITVLNIALSMAFVIGCDPSFEHRDNYVQYILRNFDKRFADGLIAQGVEGADKKDFDYACIKFRAAMLIDPDNAGAYYCYGRACKDAYEIGEEEEFIGRFKAEALEAFEVATLKDPEFADAYYYLGYAYLNMGLYVKAKLTWEKYVELLDKKVLTQAESGEMTSGMISGTAEKVLAANDSELNEIKELREEITGRLAQLEEPVKIEEGYNLILTEKYEEGIRALLPYTEGKFKTWWPLWYYLGMAYSGMGDNDKAKESFLEVLKLSPSNEDTMEKLVEIYKAAGDEGKVEKYSKKLELVRLNREEDKKLVEEKGDPAGTPDVMFDCKISEKLS